MAALAPSTAELRMAAQRFLDTQGGECPPDLECPISHRLMRQPVFTTVGQTHESDASPSSSSLSGQSDAPRRGARVPRPRPPRPLQPPPLRRRNAFNNLAPATLSSDDSSFPSDSDSPRRSSFAILDEFDHVRRGLGAADTDAN